MNFDFTGIEYGTMVCLLTLSLSSQVFAVENRDYVSGTTQDSAATQDAATTEDSAGNEHPTLHGHIRDQYGLPRIHRPASAVPLHDSVEVLDASADLGGNPDADGLTAGLIDTSDFKLVPQTPLQDRRTGRRSGLEQTYGRSMGGNGLYTGNQGRMGYLPASGPPAGSLFPDQQQPWDRDLSLGWYSLPSTTRTNASLFPPLRFPATESVSGTLTGLAGKQTQPIVPPLKMVEDWNLQQRLPSSNAATPSRLLARDANANGGVSPREESVLWSPWYKRVADAVYSAWAARAQKAQGCVHLRIVVDRARNISAAIADPLDSTPAFQQSVVEAVKTLHGSDVLAFPPQSRRTSVSFDATFRTGAENKPGVRSAVNDVETVRRRR